MKYKHISNTEVVSNHKHTNTTNNRERETFDRLVGRSIGRLVGRWYECESALTRTRAFSASAKFTSWRLHKRKKTQKYAVDMCVWVYELVANHLLCRVCVYAVVVVAIFIRLLVLAVDAAVVLLAFAHSTRLLGPIVRFLNH